MVRSPPAKIPPPNKDFLTDIIPGSTLTLDLFEPASQKDASTLRIRKVVHAYKNLFQSFSEKSFDESGDCNNDIECYPNWDKQSDAVAMVLLSNGKDLCSGALLNNTDQNFRPFFLSAFHCIDIGDPDKPSWNDPDEDDKELDTYEIVEAGNWAFRFQYKVTECNGSTVRATYTYNHADFRAAWDTTDFALMELKKSPLGNDEITWLGWDRSGNTPTEGTGIHHPQGDVMKITFDEDELSETSYDNEYSGKYYWYNQADNGTYEKGSSGSPLFDQDKRVIGQLRGGYPGCSSSKKFWHGAFHRSWTGGGDSTNQLSHWLDPCETNPETVNTLRSPYISGSSPLCTSLKTYTLHNVPSGSSVTWSATPTHLFTNPSDSSSSFFTAWDGSGSGSGTITATLSGGCGSIDIHKSIWVGKPENYFDVSFDPNPVEELL